MHMVTHAAGSPALAFDIERVAREGAGRSRRRGGPGRWHRHDVQNQGVPSLSRSSKSTCSEGFVEFPQVDVTGETSFLKLPNVKTGPIPDQARSRPRRSRGEAARALPKALAAGVFLAHHHARRRHPENWLALPAGDQPAGQRRADAADFAGALRALPSCSFTVTCLVIRPSVLSRAVR